MSEARALLLGRGTPWPWDSHMDHCALCRKGQAAYQAKVDALAAIEADAIRRADRPEARVAVEGHCECGLRETVAVHDSRFDAIVPDVHPFLPAPRPPEPDRTAALVELTEPMLAQLLTDSCPDPDCCNGQHEEQASYILAALAPSPDEAQGG